MNLKLSFFNICKLILKSKARIIILSSPILTSTYIFYNYDNESNFVGARFLRTFYIGIFNSLDYKWSLRGLNEINSLYNETIDQCHLRCASRILHGCLENGGLYIKLGQGLVTLNHILPRHYISILEELHDKARAKSYKRVKQVFLEDIGKEPNELYSEFNEVPFAAASLAQVHEATLKNGDKVAVKVQYYDLQSRFHSDIRTIEILLFLVEIIHPSFGFSWVLKDMKKTLLQELDFTMEADNSKRCAKDLTKFSDIYVPKVYDDLCSKRILTAEYIDGLKINETRKLKEAKVNLRWLDKLLVEAFSHQLFHTGFVHADPHPGNVLVRVRFQQRPQLVILDHGLYEFMRKENRIHLCGLIKSLISQNYNLTQYHSEALGVEDWETFGEIVLQHPLNTKRIRNYFRLISSKLSEADLQYTKKMTSEHFDKIMSVLRKMPKPMLLFIRNLNSVRAVCSLHGDPINRYYYMTDSAIRASHQNETHRNVLLSTFLLYFELGIFKCKIRLFNIREFFGKFTLSLYHYFGIGPSVKEIESLFESTEHLYQSMAT